MITSHDRPSDTPAVPAPSSPPLPAPSSPPPLDSFPDGPADLRLDLYDDVYFDDEGLSAVEKIYLFSRSKAQVHRVFIARSLHSFLADVSPQEAVEYVLPLLYGLATDDEEPVKEALATSIVEIMWWFFQNCLLVQEEPPDEPHDPPLLPVQTFTPILGSLLVEPNAMVCGPARFAVVESLNRLRAADSSRQNFGPAQRLMLEHEIIHQVIIGMGRLDVDSKPQFSLSASAEAAPSSPPPSPPIPTISPLIPPIPPLSPGDISLPSIPPLLHTSLQAQETPLALASASPPPSPSSPPPPSEANLQDTSTDEDDGRINNAQRSFDSQEDAHVQAAIGRCSSMSLIATVTANATLPEETRHVFTCEVVRMGTDPLYWVRREASFALGALAKVVPTELVLLSLLPLFETLSHDTVWQVRHSSIFALPGILARLTPQHRRTLALDTLRPLAVDVAPTVRSGVLEVLGEVIYTFHKDEDGVPTEIVALFVGADDGERAKSKQLNSVLETNEHAARFLFVSDSPGLSLQIQNSFIPRDDPTRALIASFNYPAVALSLGPSRWVEVREYYLALARSRNLRVRRTIAAGLGEMARILGGSLAQRDLLDVWDALVHDPGDGETRLRVLRGAIMFMGALPGAVRAGVADGLVALWERWLGGWRERECLAGALGGLAPLLRGREDVVRVLLGRALGDTAAAVREAAVKSVVPVLRALEDRPHLAEILRTDLESFASADACRRRATYIACARALVESEDGAAELTRDAFWAHVLPLSRDPVVDVRIGVARLLALIYDKFDAASPPEAVRDAVARLGRDPARDVRAYVECVLVGCEGAGGETPPGGFATFSRPPRTPVLDAGAGGVAGMQASDLV